MELFVKPIYVHALGNKIYYLNEKQETLHRRKRYSPFRYTICIKSDRLSHQLSPCPYLRLIRVTALYSKPQNFKGS